MSLRFSLQSQNKTNNTGNNYHCSLLSLLPMSCFSKSCTNIKKVLHFSARPDIITDFLNMVEIMRDERVKQFQPHNTSILDWDLSIITLKNQVASWLNTSLTILTICRKHKNFPCPSNGNKSDAQWTDFTQHLSRSTWGIPGLMKDDNNSCIRNWNP